VPQRLEHRDAEVRLQVDQGLNTDAPEAVGAACEPAPRSSIQTDGATVRQAADAACLHGSLVGDLLRERAA
jgi:hypothetical protein